MYPDEWVFIVQHSKSIHYQIVDCEHQFESRWVRLLKKLRPLSSVIRVLIPYLFYAF